ncbi:MAG: heavy-metal-associated domain-containing protein [Lachnospiraceae bacterium]|nr:heavy-metal-associated domain-containing protein [Lachnospiraceae bacterium]
MSNALIFVVVVVIFIFAVKNSIPHFMGKGACCGGGDKGKVIKPKKLDKVIAIKRIKIGGMHCENCSRRVQNALNSIEGVNAKVKLSRELAIIKIDREIDDGVFKKAITDLGYEVKE